MNVTLNISRIKKVIFHATLWLGIILIINSEIVGIQWGPFYRGNNSLFWALLYGMGINAALFYINAYWQIPRQLKLKKYGSFIGWSIVLLIGFTGLEIMIDYAFMNYISIPDLDNPGELKSGEQYFKSFSELSIFMFSVLFFNLGYWALAFLYRLPKDWMLNERQKQQLVRDKLIAELEFLKAQINPHFLFNGINSIYHLITENPKIAQVVLLKFSDLLRYQLYECNEEFIPIKKEVDYVSNYIGLQKVRKGEDAVVEATLPAEVDLAKMNGLRIAPLLLNPFLENAFKYLSLYSDKEDNQLYIKLAIENGNLEFSVRNTIDHMGAINKSKPRGGIGLENVKRRLNLLYPDSYSLVCGEEEDKFSVNLKINLS